MFNKKNYALIALFVALICLSGCKGVTGENVKIDSTLPDSVMFYPVCPKCDHISSITYRNISEGDEEEYSEYYVCEKCDHLYEFTIRR